VKLENYFVV